MSPLFTATPARTLGCCVACLLGQVHLVCDTSLPVVQRATITATRPARPEADPDLPGYLAEPVPQPPAI